MNYHEQARKWLFDYGGSNGFSVGTCNQLAEWIERSDKWDKAYGGVYDDEMPFTPERISLVMNFVNDHFPDFDTPKEFEDMIAEYTDWETELTDAENLIKVIKELAETALSKYVSIQGAYNTRTSALELILGVINDSSISRENGDNTLNGKVNNDE